MQHDFLQIEVDGEELESLYVDLIKLEVELDDELASMFRMRLCMLQTNEGWTNLDDERLRVWSPIVIVAGFEDDNEELLSGYITHIKPHFHANPEQSFLEVWGMDSSVLMDRVEKLKDWPSKKDSDIAAEIFQSYGLTPDVEDTEYVHDESVSTIIQRETDMQFLKRLALRNGYECYVQNSTGVFKKPAIDEETQPILAVHFGNETNMHNFVINVDGMSPASVGMFQVDRLSKEVLDINIDSSDQTPLGGTEADGILGQGMEPGQVFVGMNGASASAEMEALCKGLYHKAEWFVTAQGEVSANHYQHILFPRKPVTIKGVGETYSGVYYVNHVTHEFTAEGYSQTVKLKRNGLELTGDEDFGSGLSLGVGL